MRKQWRRNLPALCLCAGFLALAGVFEAASQDAGLAQGYLVTSAAQGRNAALAQAAGEFRIVAANLIYSKVVDHYHHQYMATGGDWSKNESILPLLQVIVALDRHFVDAYSIMGGTILPRTGRAAEGERVLKAGMQANPDNYKLNYDMAMLLSYTEHRPADALPYAKAARAFAKDDFSRNLMTRLCRTLHRDIREAAAPTPSAPKINAPKINAPPAPASAAAPGSPRPSG